MSKLLERHVFRQLYDYLARADLQPRLQSAYRIHHSTETAGCGQRRTVRARVTRLVSGLRHCRSRHSSDSASRLVWCRRPVLDWIRSYLTDRIEWVRRGMSRCTATRVRYGVPQRSVSGPLLFILYTADLVNVIETHGLHPHLYADGTWIQSSCCPESVDTFQSTLSDCFDEVWDWMRSNRVQQTL